MSGGAGMGMGNGPAVSGAKTVSDLFKHGRGKDRQKRKPRNSSVQSVVNRKPSGKTWQGRDV